MTVTAKRKIQKWKRWKKEKQRRSDFHAFSFFSKHIFLDFFFLKQYE
jgi:hypothetical protein